LGYNERLVEYTISANIVYGFHAGDLIILIAKTVEMATRRGVNIGVHPVYPGLQGFGRRFMDLSLQKISDSIIYQMGALEVIVKLKIDKCKKR